MEPQHSPKAQALALRIAREQGDADPDLSDWLANRTYPLELLEAAARGDVQALAAVRAEAGLPVFS